MMSTNTGLILTLKMQGTEFLGGLGRDGRGKKTSLIFKEFL